MPFLELLYINDSSEQCTVFVKVDSPQNVPENVTIDNQLLRPSVTFLGETAIAVCNMPSISIPGCQEICGSIDMYLVDTDSAVENSAVDADDMGSPGSVSSKGSEDTDCTVETVPVLHESPNYETSQYLRELAASLDNYGTPLQAYRGYNAEGLYRFDFKGPSHLVCASMVLLRKLATDLCRNYSFSPCFDIPSNFDLPWCRLTFQVLHTQVADHNTVNRRLLDTHSEIMAEHDYMYEETALTDLSVDNGVVIDSRYLATENPWKMLFKLFRSMLPPKPREVAESKEEGVEESKG